MPEFILWELLSENQQKGCSVDLHVPELKPDCGFTETFGNFGTEISRAKFQFLSLLPLLEDKLANTVNLAGPGLPNIVPIP